MTEFDYIQATELLHSVNECTIMEFCDHLSINGIHTQCIQCHKLFNDLVKSRKFYKSLSAKIRTSLKKYASHQITDKAQYDSFETLLKPNGNLLRLYNRIQYLMGISINANIEFELNLNQLIAIRAKLKKKYQPPVQLVTTDTTTDTGCIYIIRTRASLNAKENVYKIGKTSKTFHSRMNGYDKGYETIIVYPVPETEIDAVERRILDSVATQFDKFKQRTDYGSEYFEGNCLELARFVIDILIAQQTQVNSAND